MSQEKYTFDDLPNEILCHIQRQLPANDEKSRSAFNITCKRFFCVTNEQRLLATLLRHVMSGNQDQAEKILTNYPYLVTKKITATDWSNRTFHCSAFEYAFWALDVRYMCPMMLDCLPKTEKGDILRLQLLQQAQTIEKTGLTYKLKEMNYTESHFSLKPLKEALQVLSDNFDAWNKQERDLHYCTVIGQTQVPLPTYIRQQYCSYEELCEANPTFKTTKFTRRLCLDVMNNKYKNVIPIWNDKLEGLGSHFAIDFNHMVSNSIHYKFSVDSDLHKLTILENVRLKDVLELIDRLKKPLQAIETTHTMQG